ncbi:hypothetical protein H5410_020017 [Solanum commersonii]|uniref:Uncharacterized protein n=1 Tax=Solanum commersonii TaxID=4109 RepID=A0A9J5Z9Z1_SOLCO|nr:hypothetical protein H5410_020017 [Solanum commersonii]
MKIILTFIIALLVIQEVSIFHNRCIHKASIGIGMWPLLAVSARRRPMPPPPPPPKGGPITGQRARSTLFPPPPPY